MERCIILRDIQDAICSITESHATLANRGNQNGGPDEENNSSAANTQIRCKDATSFSMNAAAAAESDDERADIPLRAITTTDISLFLKDKGCALCNDDGNYLCPLQWWKLNKVK
jgi:hypothetical protein